MELNVYQENFSEAFSQAGLDTNELLKAMQAGAITGRDTVNQSLTYEPLKLESLDKTVKLLDFRMKDTVLWKSITKLPAYNTLEEYLQLESYGAPVGGFYGEGETPDVQDSSYKRRSALIKYLQVAGEVTLQAQVVKSVVTPMEKEIDNKVMWLIRAASNALTRADDAMVPKEFKGIFAQHASIGASNENVYLSLDEWQRSISVIDLRGASLKQPNLVDGATNINSIYGNADTLFAPPTVIDGLNKDYYQRMRSMIGGSGSNINPGFNVKAISTLFGDVSINVDLFMKTAAPRALTGPTASATSQKAPSAPTAVSQGLTGADAGSQFAVGGVHSAALGTVFYAVSALNEYGESALTVIANTTAITLTAGQSVDIKWLDGGGVFPATAYQVYRSRVTTAANATTGNVQFYPIFKVSTAQVAAGYDGAAATFVRDRNRFLPDTENALLYENNDDLLALLELMPISKLNLAVTGPSNRFMCYYFLTPRLAQPKKIVRYINIGPYAG